MAWGILTKAVKNELRAALKKCVWIMSSYPTVTPMRKQNSALHRIPIIFIVLLKPVCKRNSGDYTRYNIVFSRVGTCNHNLSLLLEE